jgi:excisionase family DNA binding protein
VIPMTDLSHRNHLSRQPEAAAAYLGVAEAAELTSTSIWFWRRMAYDGTVTSLKLGNRLLIPRTEVERLVAENTRPRTAQNGAGAVTEKP